MDNITRLDNAKAMRAMGAPLNTPVKERKLSARSAKKIDAAARAINAFGDAVLSLVLKQDEKLYTRVWRAWDKLDKALARSESEPKWIKQPNGDSKLLNPEAMIVHAFTEPMRIICNQWGEILDHLENGQELKITYGQGPWPLGPPPDVADRALVVGLHGDDGPGGAA
jgi:hypothetical protein